MVEVYNKIDLLESAPRLEHDADGKPARVWLSAETGEGCELLDEAIAAALGGTLLQKEVALRPEQSRLRAALYEMGAVQTETFTDDGSAQLQVSLPRADWDRLMARELR